MPLLETKGAASAQGFGFSLQRAGAVQAEAIDFDGTNDFLRRTSDLTGNTDGKTFTFSFWTWIPVGAPLGFVYYANNAGTGRFLVEVGAGQTARIRGWRTTGAITLDVTTSSVIPAGTFVNVLVSVDLANAANRSIYINDVLTSATWTTYGNNDIEFTCSQHDVCSNGSAADGAKRLSNIFLDYTYRDMSITANRRLFVTADLKPAAGQAALNPILYLPMSDPTAPGLNAGTGGNFTLTGTVARSGRGPNQYNAPYSDLDGTADYLERTTAPTGIADGKQFTFSVCINIDTLATNPVFIIATSTTPRLYINIDNGSGDIDIGAYNSSGTLIFRAQASSGTLVAGRNYQFVASFDLSNTSNRYAYLNGQALTMTYPTYLNQDIDFAVASTPVYRVGRSASTIYSNANIGALWFNTSYIDLSVAANLAKFVTGTGIDAKPVDLGANGELPTGTSPLIYLPMYGNNAGRNYGTGGDFTVNSGPYPGARGPNEFWGNWANITTGSSGLRTTSGVGTSNSGTFSISCSFNIPTSGANTRLFSATNASNAWRLDVYISDTGILTLLGRNAAGTTRLSATSNTGITYNANQFLQLSIDLSNSASRNVFINGNSFAMTWATYANDTLELSSTFVGVGCFASSSGVSGGLTGRLAEFYFTTTYIDFSQEANRLRFRDAFGNPVNLTQQIEALAIPNPAIYMRFPPTSFGTNSGTGGDFTVNGTITDGGQL